MVERKSNPLTPEAIGDLRKTSNYRRGVTFIMQHVLDRLWSYKQSGIAGERGYDHTFAQLLSNSEGNSLQDVLDNKSNPLVLDLMSNGGFVRQLKGARGLSVSLSNQRSREERELDESAGNGFIKGDLKRSTTWRNISDWISNNGRGDGFDMITIRPVAGLLSIPMNETFYKYALAKCYSLLTNQEGYLFAQFDSRMLNFVNSYVERLSAVKGVQVKVLSTAKDPEDHPTFMLVKHEEAPKSLKELPL